MTMISCKNGHYYDKNKHPNRCPYCSGSNLNISNVGKTQEIDRGTKQDKTPLKGKETEVYNPSNSINSNEGKTQLIFGSKISSNNSQETKIVNTFTELAGWIVIISERGKGRSFDITFGMNTIGRDISNHIVINNGDKGISLINHTSILYDFENNYFYIQHNNGKYLTYLNRKLVGGLTELKAYDKIKIAKTEFIFIPLCGENFQWELDEE